MSHWPSSDINISIDGSWDKVNKAAHPTTLSPSTLSLLQRLTTRLPTHNIAAIQLQIVDI
jgi:hypothetical protein